MQEPVKAKKTDNVRKPAGALSQKRAGDDLTCSESQIEDILSEGESTTPVDKMDNMDKTGRGLHQKRQLKSPL
jgi:hypothetical protein